MRITYKSNIPVTYDCSSIIFFEINTFTGHPTNKIIPKHCIIHSVFDNIIIAGPVFSNQNVSFESIQYFGNVITSLYVHCSHLLFFNKFLISFE